MIEKQNNLRKNELTIDDNQNKSSILKTSPQKSNQKGSEKIIKFLFYTIVLLVIFIFLGMIGVVLKTGKLVNQIKSLPGDFPEIPLYLSHQAIIKKQSQAQQQQVINLIEALPNWFVTLLINKISVDAKSQILLINQKEKIYDANSLKNSLKTTIDNWLSTVPLINSAKVLPKLQVNPLDGSKRLVWKNIKEIDLSSYGPNFRLGLDLQGGAQLIYDADLSNIPLTEQKDALEGAKDVIERRVNALGVSEPIVQTSISGQKPRISVELAGVYDIKNAIKMIGETPLLEFKEENPNAIKLTPEQEKQLEQMNLEVRKRAVEVLQKAKNGEDFAKLAKQYSEDPGTKDNGGFYTIKNDNSTVPEFEQAANKLKPGEISSDLVQTVYGYHIIKKEADRGMGDDKEMDVRHILFLTKTPKDLGITQPEEWINTKLSGKNLKKAVVQYNSTTMIPEVSLEFDNEGAQLFAEITEKNVNKPIAIFLDGYLISAPKVNETIYGGKAVISGNFSLDEAKKLAQRLNAGALPVPINLVSQSTVGATLGSVAVQKSLIAGLWGLLAVAIFMILYYRLPGLISVIALGIYTTISLAIFKLFPGYTLTLAGITGFILSIGMAVDANILIFERMKEELKSGKDLIKAIEEGFSRAWTSIRDSNISSLITCLILWWFGSSIIKGFALTLALGIMVSMFSAIVISRQLLFLIAGWRIKKYKWLYNAK